MTQLLIGNIDFIFSNGDLTPVSCASDLIIEIATRGSS